MKLRTAIYECSEEEAQDFVNKMTGIDVLYKKSTNPNKVEYFSRYSDHSREIIAVWNETGTKICLMEIFSKFLPKTYYTAIKEII